MTKKQLYTLAACHVIAGIGHVVFQTVTSGVAFIVTAIILPTALGLHIWQVRNEEPEPIEERPCDKPKHTTS